MKYIIIYFPGSREMQIQKFYDFGEGDRLMVYHQDELDDILIDLSRCYPGYTFHALRIA